jgi:tetratricopeptide (TPR) repeat protein
MQEFEANLSAALDLHRRGMVADAAQAYRQLLGMVPGHAEVRHLLGVALLYLGNLPEAGQWLTAVVADYPLRPDFRLNLANCLSYSGDQAAAIAQLRCALALDPGFSAAWLNTAHIHRRARRFDQAIAGYRRGLTVTPNDAAAQASLGASLYEGARSRFTESLSPTQAISTSSSSTRRQRSSFISASVEDGRMPICRRQRCCLPNPPTATRIAPLSSGSSLPASTALRR